MPGGIISDAGEGTIPMKPPSACIYDCYSPFLLCDSLQHPHGVASYAKQQTKPTCYMMVAPMGAAVASAAGVGNDSSTIVEGGISSSQ